MTAEIISLDENRPHLVIEIDNCVHVVPVSLAKKWAKGESVPEKEIMNRIITEWLDKILENHGE